MKVLMIGDWLLLNVEEIASARRRAGGDVVTIEMKNGTRHEVGGLTVGEVRSRIDQSGEGNEA